MTSFSWQSRAAALKTLNDQHFDLIVIGGGITGAGVLRDAAMRGLRTLLLEKGDFASGTSSRSSKLVHGGLRYLKQYDFALTREACHERNLLVRQNPHLVKPIPFLFPIYDSDPEGPIMVRAGMWLYEALSGFQNVERHRMLSTQEALEIAPDLKQTGLRGAAFYYDAAVDDVRLTLETIKSGVRHESVALNYVRVIDFLYDTGKVIGVKLLDTLDGRALQTHGGTFINASGIWVDEVRNLDARHRPELRPTKGIHMVIPAAKIKQDATVAFSGPDGRLLFAIPWGEVTLIGTTDTFFNDDLDHIHSEIADVDYLLQAIDHTFPNAGVTPKDVIATFAGARPLVRAGSEDESASAISREHQIFQDPSGLVSIAGGKLTTYRTMARELVDRVVKLLPSDRQKGLLPCRTEDPLTGQMVDVGQTTEALIGVGYPAVVAEHLVSTYGAKVPQVLAICETIASGTTPLHPDQGYLRGEVIYAIRQEAAIRLVDVLTRRLRFSIWVPCQGLDIAEDVSSMMARELGWDDVRRQAELAMFRQEISQAYRPIDEAPSPDNS